jgi:hypothetical protein
MCLPLAGLLENDSYNRHVQNRRLGPLVLALTLAILPVATFSAGGAGALEKAD